MRHLHIAATLCFAVSLIGAQAPELRVREGRVEALAEGQVIVTSPPEGLWSIACGWSEQWPAGWVHGAPAEVTSTGEWTVIEGRLDACGGTWSIRDAYRVEDRAIHGIRRFTWQGTQDAPTATLSVRFQAASDSSSVLLPGILYHGNPSGARSGRVPVFSSRPGEEALYEEHRYPMPFASVELRRGERVWGAALHTKPSLAPYGNLSDQWWSLGVIGREGATEMAAMSGPCASNGRRSVIKSFQRLFGEYDNAYLVVPPGGIIEKEFFLEAYPVEREGSGFRQPLVTSLQIFAPFHADDLPTFADAIRTKYRFAKTRWEERDGYAVFRKYQDRPFAVMGWTGQAAGPGYALQVLADGIGDPEALTMATKSLDFLTTAEFYDGGFHNWYNLEERRWEGEEIPTQGQSMFWFARAIDVGRKAGRDTSRWEDFLRRAADLHSDRILAETWHPVSTNEAAFVAPLIHASALFDNARYREAALKAAGHYARRHLSMREPYWGGTLDASSEDKEGAAIAFQAFLELYEITGEREHLDWARHACDVMLTYTYVWDVDMPPGRLRDHDLKTRGWTAVSPQNQHLDVWGALTAADVYRLGQLDHREDLEKLAIVMYRTCGQLIDPYGSQGEQLQQTNYVQGPDSGDVLRLRGGYHEAWTVFWITSHFLTGAAHFAELGVDVWGM